MVEITNTPWAKSFCPLPFRYAPVTVDSGRVASKSFFLLGYFNRTARNNMVNSAFAVAKAEFVISCTFYFLL